MEMSYCTIKKSFLVKMGYLLRHINIAIGHKNSILLKQESSNATQQGRNKTRKVGMRVLSVLIFTENVRPLRSPYRAVVESQCLVSKPHCFYGKTRTRQKAAQFRTKKRNPFVSKLLIFQNGTSRIRYRREFGAAEI